MQEEEELEKRGGPMQQQLPLPRDSVPETKAMKEQPKAIQESVKPSPSKDRKETPI